MCHPIRFLVVLVLIAAVSRSAAARTWTDATGVFTVEADLLYVQNGEAYLKLSDGKVVALGLEKFSEADQQLLKVAPQKEAENSSQSIRARLEAALRKDVRSEFVETPLTDAIDFFRAFSRVDIYVDVDVDTNVALTVPASTRSLRDTLNGLLPDHCVIIYENAIVFTKQASLIKYAEARPYRLLKRVPLDDVLEDVTQTVAPQTWSDVGGYASIRPVSVGLLFIRHSDYHHHLIEQHYADTLQPIPVADPVAVNHVERGLRKVVQLELLEVPLSDVVAFMSDLSGISVRLHPDVKDEFATTLKLEVPLASALSLICLEHKGLTWNADESGVTVLPAQAAKGQLIRKTYSLDKIALASQYNAYEDALTATVAPSSWDDLGGPGDMKVSAGQRAFAVIQTYQVHRQLDRIFASLHAAVRK